LPVGSPDAMGRILFSLYSTEHLVLNINFSPPIPKIKSPASQKIGRLLK